jgi:hypothetical protein
MNFRGGEFSTGEMGNFQPALTLPLKPFLEGLALEQFGLGTNPHPLPVAREADMRRRTFQQR